MERGRARCVPLAHRRAVMSRIRFRLSFAVLAASVAFSSAARAQSQTNSAGDEKGAFSILFENDIFDNTDHDYTNGVELGYTTSPNGTPDWAVRTARWLPFFAQTGDVRTR